MKKKKAQLDEKLFFLIATLSTIEIRRFKRFVPSTNQKGASKYIDLFDALRNQNRFSSELIISKLYSGNPISYKRSCTYLLQYVLESMAEHDRVNRVNFSVIRLAIEKGFLKYAGKLLYEELSWASENKNLSYLNDLYEMRESLRKDLGFQVKVPFGIPHYDEVIEEYLDCLTAKKGALILREVVGLDEASRIVAQRSWNKKLDSMGFDGYFPKTKAAIFRIRVILKRLDGDFVTACQIQERLLSMMKEEEQSFSVPELLSAYSLCVSFMISVERFEDASKLLHELALLERSNSTIEKQISKIWTLNAVYIAACRPNLNIADRAIRDLEFNLELFGSRMKALILHAGSIIEFSQGHWAEAISFQNRVSRITEVQLMPIAWVPNLLRAIGYFELGDFRQAKNYLVKFRGMELDSAYPKLIAEVVAGLMQFSLLEREQKSFLIEMIYKYNSIIQNQDEYLLSRYFNVLVWMNSRQLGIDIAKAIANDARNAVFSLSLVS